MRKWCCLVAQFATVVTAMPATVVAALVAWHAVSSMDGSVAAVRVACCASGVAALARDVSTACCGFGCTRWCRSVEPRHCKAMWFGCCLSEPLSGLRMPCFSIAIGLLCQAAQVLCYPINAANHAGQPCTNPQPPGGQF